MIDLSSASLILYIMTYDIISGLRQAKSILLISQEVVINNFLVEKSLKKNENEHSPVF